MSSSAERLSILLVEDDVENLQLLLDSLPKELRGCHLFYDPYSSFDRAVEKLKWQRFDMVVTDIYHNRVDGQKKAGEEDARARDIVSEVRSRRFCPVVAYTDGSFPESLDKQKGPFLKLADKSKGNEEIIAAMEAILKTQIPQIARKIHDEIDHVVGPCYLWGFLENQWENLEKEFQDQPNIIERLIRRRAAIQMEALDPAGSVIQEIENITGPEYYIMPPISDSFRLGHILRKKENGSIYVVLTPHCHLTIQEGQNAPRADHILLVAAFPFHEVIEFAYTKKTKEGTCVFKCPWSGSQNKIPDKIRRHIKSPPDMGSPAGRYWFLPSFLNIPALYCDFMRIQSVSYETIISEFEPLAVLDSPFAEAFQSCFTSFYSSVGLPNLDPVQFRHLVET